MKLDRRLYAFNAVFATCVTLDNNPLMILDVSKDAPKVAATSGRESAMVTVHTRNEETRTWISKTIAGEVLDLGRDPICEVYRLDGGTITEVGVCFQRHDDGSYSGYVTRRDPRSHLETRQKLACTYPMEQER